MTKPRTWTIAFAGVASLIAIGITAGSYSTRAAADAANSSTQDVQSLDRRISFLEQRLFMIESRISRVEQQVAVNIRAPGSSQQNRTEIELRQQIEAMKAQINQITCGLARLDERTLSVAARQSERRNGNSTPDPCRLNPETPLRLSTRP